MPSLFFPSISNQQAGDDQDIPMVSSAPSSAYYSDLSVIAVPTERAYEVVGLTMMSSTLPNWEQTAENSFSIVSDNNSGGGGSGNNTLNPDGSSTTLQTTTNLGLSSANSMSCGPTTLLPGQTNLHHHHHHGSNILISPIAGGNNKKSARLSAINESASIPSDYV